MSWNIIIANKIIPQVEITFSKEK